MLQVASRCCRMPLGKNTRANVPQFSLFCLQEKRFAIIFALSTGFLSSQTFCSDYFLLFRTQVWKFIVEKTHPVIPSWRGYDPFLIRNGVRYCCKLRWFTLYSRMQIILVILHHWNSLSLSSLLHHHCSDWPTAMKEMHHAAILSIWRTMSGEAIWGAYWSHTDLLLGNFKEWSTLGRLW